MNKILEIKSKLAHGEIQLVSKISGVPYETVRKILTNKRSADTAQGKKIIRAAKAIIRNRQSLIKSVK